LHSVFTEGSEENEDSIFAFNKPFVAFACSRKLSEFPSVKSAIRRHHRKIFREANEENKDSLHKVAKKIRSKFSTFVAFACSRNHPEQTRPEADDIHHSHPQNFSSRW
jgi:hypothetical protein